MRARYNIEQTKRGLWMQRNILAGLIIAAPWMRYLNLQLQRHPSCKLLI